MRVIRRVTNNLKEVELAKHVAERSAYENANQLEFLRPVIVIPEYTFEEFEFCFKLINFQSYYLEDRGDPDPDILANINGEGLVRIKYDPLVINQFDLYLSLFA